jgi:hypothetical protein
MQKEKNFSSSKEKAHEVIKTLSTLSLIQIRLILSSIRATKISVSRFGLLTLQLLFRGCLRVEDTEGADKFPKLDDAIVLDVKQLKHLQQPGPAL